ncbi:MAG: hypothetical protein OEY30_03100, partial [Candidatus Bathyarchaeota archaeon]|nr:hypothetical protein [Candidatus Bathyarchaeota archaeon]
MSVSFVGNYGNGKAKRAEILNAEHKNSNKNGEMMTMASYPHSIFMPNRGLQRQEIPVHITWEDPKVKVIKVDLSFPLKIKEAYNIPPEIRSYSGSTVFRKFEVNGYLGLVLSSSRIPPGPPQRMNTHAIRKQKVIVIWLYR